jgi:ABC-2 type transport system ATP-binding protein
MITVQNVTKKFGNVVAVNGISFSVEKGQTMGFLGPNGAGKSTTMKMISCFFPPTSGSISVAGFDAIKGSLDVRRRIGYMPENVPLYPEMRVGEYLNFRSKLRGLSGGDRKKKLGEAVGRCGLESVLRKQIGFLSKGYRQRVGLADAILHSPEVVILDEPTIGLDPNQIRQTRQLIRELGADRTVILSTHILTEVEMVCNNVTIIHRGKIVTSGKTETLVKDGAGKPKLRVEVAGPAEKAEDTVKGVKGFAVLSSERMADSVKFVLECEGEDPGGEKIFRAVSAAGLVLRELGVQKPTLEDVFVRITSRDETL